MGVKWAWAGGGGGQEGGRRRAGNAQPAQEQYADDEDLLGGWKVEMPNWEVGCCQLPRYAKTALSRERHPEMVRHPQEGAITRFALQ
jgi:hypothetical protein